MSIRLRDEAGFAMLVAVMGLLIMSAAGLALILATSTETMIARNFGDGTAAMYAAEAVAVKGLADLALESDWTQVVGGPARSSFFDGTGTGARTLPDRSTIDLTAIVNAWNCGKPDACSDADLDRVTAERPWGGNNPRWRVYACGMLARLGESPSPYYVLLLAADDPLETDGNPLVDGTGSGHDVVLFRGEAFGSGGTHSMVEFMVTRAEDASVRVLSRRLLR
jgi:hypothetical protein